MPESYLIKGLLVGLVFGVPAGAIGTLTIQRVISYGFQAGLATGMGSSAADVLYAGVGVFGLTMASRFLLAHQTAIGLLGGGLIILLGVAIIRKKTEKTDAIERRTNLPMCFGSSFAIALGSPTTILSFFAAFAALGISERMAPAQGMWLILGILLGTSGWWAALSGIVALFRQRITDKIYRILNRLLGGLMVLFGAAMMLRSFFNS